MSNKANGGYARAASLTSEERLAISRKANAARWAGHVKGIKPKRKIYRMDDEMLQELSRNALRQAMETISRQLRELALDEYPSGLTPQQALTAAADAILSCNASVWGGSA